MTERYISYGLGGDIYDVPESESATFEERNPSATVEMHIGKDVFDVPLSEKENFLKVNGDSVSYLWDNEKDDKTSLFETIGKGLGAAGVGTAKLALDLGQAAWQNTLGLFDDKRYDEVIQDESNPVTRASMRLGELQERLSREADPTGGQTGFLELIKEGKIGKAAQKALGSGLESLPMMLAAGTGWGAALYGAAMAADKYAEETRENDDIPAWKRGVNAIGSAALEMAVEKIGGPLKNIGGKASKEFTEEMAKEILEDMANEGTEKIAKRIFDVLKKPVKEGLEEGGEEVLTSFGNDALGEALDIIDGDQDYGIRAQWEQMKEENPDASLSDFAKAKGEEYIDSFLGGALSGMEIAGTTDAINLGINRSKNNDFQQARVIGAERDINDLYDVDDQLKQSVDKVEQAFVDKDGQSLLSRDFIDGLTADEAYELSENEGLSYEQKKALYWYAKSKAVEESLNAKLDAELAAKIDAQNNIINEVVSEGVVVTGLVNNKPVYIKGGVANNGSVTLPDGTNGPVVVVDSITGEQTTVRTEDIKYADSVNAEEYKSKIDSQLRDNDAHNREVWRNNMSFAAKFRDIKQYANSKITINSANGLTDVTVLEIDDEKGKVLIKGKKGDLGNSELYLSADMFYDAIARKEDGTPIHVEALPKKEQEVKEVPVEAEKPSQNVVSDLADFRDGEYIILIDGNPVNVEVTSQNDASDTLVYSYKDANGNTKVGRTSIGGFKAAVEEGMAYQPAVAPTPRPEVDETVVEEKPIDEAPEEVPVTPETIDWDALFANDTEAFFTEMQNQFGDESVDYIGAIVESTQDEINSLGKMKGKSTNQIIADKKRQKDLQKKLDILNNMVARLNEPIVEEVVEAEPVDILVPAEPEVVEPIATPVEPEQVIVPLEKDPEPMTADEFAARELGLKKGGIKLLYDSYKHHTGFGNNERKALFDLFRTKEKGGMTLEEAGERLMELDRENNTGFFDQNDPNAGLNAILDVLGSNKTLKDLRTYTARKRQEEAQREADAMYSEVIAAYENELLYNEVRDEEIRAGYALSEDEINKLNTILAEEIYDHETGDKREADSLHEAEIIGDLPPAEGEAYGGIERSNQILQEAQSVQTTGEGDLEKRGAGEGITRQDADSSVYDGEPAVHEGGYAEEITSSLDEDMPDFTTEAPKTPVAPKPVDDPIAEAQKREESVAPQLTRRDIPRVERQDMAYNAGKAIADMFATREDYGAYEEVATADFGEFLSDFNRGVDASFAERNSKSLDGLAKFSEIENEQPTLSSNENIESVKKFMQNEIDAYFEKYNKIVPTYLVDISSKSDMAKLLGISEDELTDEDMEFIREEIEENDKLGGYGFESKEIGIFVKSKPLDSKKIELVLMHENIHALAAKDNTLLWIGQYLWINAKKGTREHKYRSAIAKKEPKHRWYDEMAAYVISEHMQNGTIGALESILDSANIVRLNDLLNKLGYDKETETTARKNGTSTSVQRNIVDSTVAGEDSQKQSEEDEIIVASIISSLNGVGIDANLASDEKAEQMKDASGANEEFMVASDRPVFVSNAAVALEAINMGKATPEQWLKMITKAGGIKAGEDKWMGLSDWLKASDKKTLTKQEVLYYIKANTIQIEEVNYSEINYNNEDRKQVDVFKEEFEDYVNSWVNAGSNVSDATALAYERMAVKYGDKFQFAFMAFDGELYVNNREEASKLTGIPYSSKSIDETRLGYTTAGLDNLKEIALVVPTIESWNQSDLIHFGDAGDGRAVAWVRFGDLDNQVKDSNYKRLQEIYDRLDEIELKVQSSGISMEEYEERARLREERDKLQEIETKTQKVLVIDEIQSKRHQEGREKGYIPKDYVEIAQESIRTTEAVNNFIENHPFNLTIEEKEELSKLKEANRIARERLLKYRTAIPDAPFDKNWHELAMKRMLRYAAENGYDVIAWTKGAQQAERYDIGGVVESINYAGSFKDGIKDIDINLDTRRGGNIHLQVDNDGKVINEYNDSGDIENSPYIGKNLSEILGKELANKVLSLDEEQEISGEGLHVGGEGMKGFYDKMLPSFMNKYGKKWGVKVEDIEMPNVEEAGRIMHSVPVTEAMKASVMEGQPMFMKRPNGKVYGWTDGKDIYYTEDGFNPNTLVHEYTHIWAKAMMKQNPTGWNSIKELLKKTPVWKQVMSDANYSQIHNNEDLVASEVLSRISGKDNAAKLRKMYRQMVDEAKGTARKLEVQGFIQNIKDALNKFWGWVGKELFKIEKFNSVEEITDRVLWDLYNQTDLGVRESGTIEAQITPTTAARETAAAVYDRAAKNRWQEFQREFQDAFQPVRIAIEAIQQETGNIPVEDYENYLLIQNQTSSRSRNEIDKFVRRHYSPIVKQVNAIVTSLLESRGLDVKNEQNRANAYQEVINYLIAKHGIERNKYYQSTKTRPMTKEEQQPLLDEAKRDYETTVNMINMNNNLTEAERDLKLREALDVYNAAQTEIKTRQVPAMRDYSGLTALFNLDAKQYEKAEELAQEMVDEFESLIDTEKLWSKINAATDKTLRHSYESGMLSRQQYNDIKSMFKFYVPLRGFSETTAEDVYSYSRFEGNRFNPAVKTAKGRTSVADDPIALIMNMAESEIAQGNKNIAKQALYNFLLNRTAANNKQNSLMQLEDVWYVISVDDNGNKVYQIAAPDHETGETYEEFENRMRAKAENGEAEKSAKGKLDVGMRFQKQKNRDAHYVYLKVNGVDKAIFVNGDPKAAEAINGTDKPKPNALVEKARSINRLLSSMFTNYSLEFTARNYFRDMIYSRINIDVRESDPEYRKKFRQNWRHNNLGTMLKMLKAYRAGEYENRPLTESEAAFVEFMENGGQTGYTVINSVESHKKDLEKAIKNMQKGIENGGVKDSTVFKYTLGAVEMLNEASELVTRFAAFKTSRDIGRDVVTSISNAKEITVNFNTKGAQDGKGWMGAMASYFGWSKFFFNASVQGIQSIKAMADANKLKFCTTVGGVAAFGFMVPVVVSAIAEAMGGDEDEYWNIPEYERQSNFCIPVGGGKYAKIPLPVGFREIYAIGDMVAAMAFDKMSTRDVQQVGTDMANKIASVVLPINPLESQANGLSIWHTLINTALPSSAQFAVQNLTNVDWKGAPLQKEYTYNENDPQWMKAFNSNPDWMVGLSKWCNEHINLDGDYKGMDWSPEKLDNTLSNLFGGIYSLIKKTGKSFSMIWNEENRNLSNIPLSGVVLGSGIDKDDRFVNDVYFEEKDFYDSQINYIKRRAKMFGYDLDDVFEKQKGQHHPKMMEIYTNKHFDFMQEWYKGNKDLDRINNAINKLEREINSREYPSEVLLMKLAQKNEELARERRDFVNDMLELD